MQSVMYFVKPAATNCIGYVISWPYIPLAPKLLQAALRLELPASFVHAGLAFRKEELPRPAYRQVGHQNVKISLEDLEQEEAQAAA
jgi:hypothetical protein